MKLSEKLFASFPDMISPENLIFESQVATVPCQSNADSSRERIVERHVQCVEHKHFAESAAQWGSSR